MGRPRARLLQLTKRNSRRRRLASPHSLRGSTVRLRPHPKMCRNIEWLRKHSRHPSLCGPTQTMILRSLSSVRRLRDVRRKKNYCVNRKRSAKPLRPWLLSRLRPPPEEKAPNKLPQLNQRQVLPPHRVSLSWLENRKLAPQKRRRRRTPISVHLARTRKRRNGTSSTLTMC